MDYLDIPMPDVAVSASGGVDAIAMLISMLLVILIFIVALVIWIKACKNMARIAADKGYTERKWFHYCFWLGMIGFVMVCAMPDKNRR